MKINILCLQLHFQKKNKRDKKQMEMKKFVVCFERAAGSPDDRRINNLRTVAQIEKTLDDKNLADQFNIVEGAGRSAMTVNATDAAVAEIRKTAGVTTVNPYVALDVPSVNSTFTLKK